MRGTAPFSKAQIMTVSSIVTIKFTNVKKSLVGDSVKKYELSSL